MAIAEPLYTLTDQFNRLDEVLPSTMEGLNTIRIRLLLACSSDGNINKAKNRFLHLIQDTELKTLFASLIEIPETKVVVGVNSAQKIFERFGRQLSLFDKGIGELKAAGIPYYTLNLLEDYYYGNEDPVYQLSIFACMVFFGYIIDDYDNNRKD